MEDKGNKKIFLTGKENYENILDCIEINEEKQDKHLKLYPKSRSGALRLKINDYYNLQLDINLSKNIEAIYIFELEQIFNLDIKIVMEKDSKLNLIIIDREEKKKNKVKLESVSVISKEYSKTDIIKIDFGEYDKDFNYTSDLIDISAEANITLAYVLNNKQKYDMTFNQIHKVNNTIGNINIEGVLKDESNKMFKGTIDFKEGSEGSIGNEKESVVNYGDKTKSVSLPILFSSVDEIKGNHASNHGKFDEEQLYYIQTRGFSLEEAKNIVAESKLIPILDKVKNRELKEELKIDLKDKLKK